MINPQTTDKDPQKRSSAAFSSYRNYTLASRLRYSQLKRGEECGCMGAVIGLGLWRTWFNARTHVRQLWR